MSLFQEQLPTYLMKNSFFLPFLPLAMNCNDFKDNSMVVMKRNYSGAAEAISHEKYRSSWILHLQWHLKVKNSKSIIPNGCQPIQLKTSQRISTNIHLTLRQVLRSGSPEAPPHIEVFCQHKYCDCICRQFPMPVAQLSTADIFQPIGILTRLSVA